MVDEKKWTGRERSLGFNALPVALSTKAQMNSTNKKKRHLDWNGFVS